MRLTTHHILEIQNQIYVKITIIKNKNNRMHFLTIITLVLSVLLILAIRLLYRFSYDTFIPWNIGFGLFLYIETSA